MSKISFFKIIPPFRWSANPKTVDHAYFYQRRSYGMPRKQHYFTGTDQQDISPLNIAIALDNTVVPKAHWETTLIRDGSQLLIIKAVQGG